MTRKTKLLGATTGLLAAAAFTGMLTGTAQRASASTAGIKATRTTVVSNAGAKAVRLDDTAKHACKGQNACKGQGGCKGATNDCKGKNACKGQGNCKTDGSAATQPG